MKKKLGAKNFYYPTLTVIVGANVDNKPNYITIAWGGIIGTNTLYIAMNKSHYTNKGIKENNSFSVNIPSVNLVKETDYCGIYSGKVTDKSKLFHSFYGKLGNAPMIEECTVNMECELVQTINIHSHDIFIGRITETFCQEECLTKGKADLSKIQPLLFSFHDSTYWTLGASIAKAWNIGKELNK